MQKRFFLCHNNTVEGTVQVLMYEGQVATCLQALADYLLLPFLLLPHHTQVVNVLEQRAHPTHIAWKGGALLAALDAGRENWLPRHQWVQGGMVLRAPTNPKLAKQVKAGPNSAGTPVSAAANSLSTAAAGRHAKLCYYIKAEQGQL